MTVMNVTISYPSITDCLAFILRNARFIVNGGTQVQMTYFDVSAPANTVILSGRRSAQTELYESE